MPTRHLKILAVPAALFLIALYLLVQDYRQDDGAGASADRLASLSSSIGDVKRKPKTRMLWFNAKNHQDLYRKDTLRTAKGSTATIRLNSGDTIELGENSLIVLEKTKGQIAVDFMGGNMVSKGGGSGLLLRSKGVEIDASKAQVELSAKGGADASIQVKDGNATVKAGGKKQTLGANQSEHILPNGGLSEVAEIPTRLLTPDRHQLVLQAHSEGKAPVEFKWEDLKSGVKQKLELSHDEKFSDIVQTIELGPSNQGVQTRKLDLSKGAYYWRIVSSEEQAANNHGTKTASEDPRSFEIRSIEPIRLLSPNPDEVVRQSHKKPVQVTFRWRNPEFVDETRVEIAEDAEFKKILKKESAQQGTELTLALEARAEPIYWRVVGASSHSRGEIESDPRKITLKPIDAPSAVDGLSPRQGSTVVAQEDNPLVSFRWAPQEEVPSYQLQISKDESFSKLIDDIETSSPTLTWNAKLNRGQLYWRVIAKNSDGETGKPSAPQSFSLISSLPIQTLDPPERAQFTADPTANKRPSEFKMSWEKDSQAQSYEVQLSRDPHFGPKAITLKSNQPETTAESLPDTTWSEGIYYWRVKALDGGGNMFRASLASSFELKAKDALKPPEIKAEIFKPSKLVTARDPASLDPIPDPKTRNPDQVQLRWSPVENAGHYEIEVKRGSETLLNKQVKDPSYEANFKPGLYTYRVRGKDLSGKPGEWSSAVSFVVKADPPSLVLPLEKEIFDKPIENKGIQFAWKPPASAVADNSTPPGKMVLQMKQADGWESTHPVKSLNDTLNWKPTVPGEYQWRIAYETPQGLEGGQYQHFEVKEGAVKTANPEEEPEIDRPAEWWVLGRFAQALTAYTSVNQDSGLAGAGASLVTQGSAELRFRQPKKAKQPWVLSAALNFEIIDQSILNTTFVLPRGNLRVFLGRESGNWKIGPFAQVGLSESGVFLLSSSTSAIQGTVLRENVGLGAFATYRASTHMMLSALGLLRLDNGGTTSALPSPLVPSLGFEAGFGVGLRLSEHWMLEGRVRAVQENFSWVPATAGLPNSSLSDLSAIIDLGIGFKF